MPRLHHPVIAALRRNGAPVQLARQPDGEVADIDHLLDLAKALRDDLAGLERHETAEILLGGPQFFRKSPHQLAAAWRGNSPLSVEGACGTIYGGTRLRGTGASDMGDDLTCDRR
jgi:hypothetical protein